MVVKLKSKQFLLGVDGEFSLHEGFVVSDEFEVGVEESAVLELV